MDPYEQHPLPPTPQPSVQQNPYEFIMSPQAPRRRFGLPTQNMGLLLALIIGGAIILIVIIVTLSSLFGGGGNKADLISLAQTQNEIVRVSQTAEKNAAGQTTKNLATTVDLSLTSQQQSFIALLAKEGVKVSTKELKLKQSGTTDQKLNAAMATSTFDSTYSSLAQTSLQSYVAALKQLHAKTNSTVERNLTADYIAQTELIISQIPTTI